VKSGVRNEESGVRRQKTEGNQFLVVAVQRVRARGKAPEY
jgi:hypothetical protein